MCLFYCSSIIFMMILLNSRSRLTVIKASAELTVRSVSSSGVPEHVHRMIFAIQSLTLVDFILAIAASTGCQMLPTFHAMKGNIYFTLLLSLIWLPYLTTKVYIPTIEILVWL